MAIILTIKHFLVEDIPAEKDGLSDAITIMDMAAYAADRVEHVNKYTDLVTSGAQALVNAAQKYQHDGDWTYEVTGSQLIYNLIDKHRSYPTQDVHSAIPYTTIKYLRSRGMRHVIGYLKDLLNTWQTYIEAEAGIKYSYPIWEVSNEDENHPDKVTDIEHDATWCKTMPDAVFSKGREIVRKVCRVDYTPNLSLTEMVTILNFVHNYTLFEHWSKNKSDRFYSIVFIK